MKIQSKIKAFFRYRDEDAEMDVSAAEIRNGRVWLHPANDKDHVYCIRSNTVDIIISPTENIQEEDVEVRNSKKPDEHTSSEPKLHNQDKAKNTSTRPTHDREPVFSYMPKMKKITFTLYPDEYEMLMSNIKENGYRKTEFLLACVSAAKKNSMESSYRKYENLHKERRSAYREAARMAQEKDQATQKIN